MNHQLVIADDQAVFRTGTARFIVVEDDFRIIRQCEDLPRLYDAVQRAKGATICFGSSLDADLERLATSAKAGENRLVAILERGESPQPMINAGVRGIIYRNVGRLELLKCLRTVGSGGTYYQHPPQTAAAVFETDMIGERVRNRLSPKELQIIRLLIKGYKNKDIAVELNNSEQVIKNYLRSIFDKTGVSDRLELALFTIHHRVLLDAVEGKTTRRGATPVSAVDDAVLIPNFIGSPDLRTISVS